MAVSLVSSRRLGLFLACLLLLPLVHPAETSATTDSLFDTLDADHNAQLDRQEYAVGLQKLQAFLAKELPPPNTSWSFPLIPTWSLERFGKAFSSSFCMILATEIGDKTFFIAAVLSMKHDRMAVFGGAILALIIMTVLSTAMGLVLPQILPAQYTHWLGGILFLYFGCKLVYDSRHMEAGRASEELEEVEEELLQQSNKKMDVDDVESGKQQLQQRQQQQQQQRAVLALYQVGLQALSLTFVAEWGDRSQIATIALAASNNPYGVTLGGCCGHAVCTGLAVVGGRMLAARISEKTVSLYGGLTFLVFGVHSLFFE